MEISPILLLALATAMTACSGAPLLIPKVPAGEGQKCAALLMTIAALVGLAASGAVLCSGSSARYVISWNLPIGAVETGIDPLSAIFLIPVFLLSGCSALYALGYWQASDHSHTVRQLTFWHGFLSASMIAVLLARDGVLFLVSWEIMALAAFFALTTEHHRREVREAGLLYLITANLGSLALIVHFALLKAHTSTFSFPGQGALDGATAPAAVLFLAALAGFGFKAGLMPFHIWLPSAHAAAPSHISALMSGVLIKTGIYGIIRVCSFFHAPPTWWGMLVLALGMISAVAGVLFAIGQHDLKRLLAYHSIENIGIIALGIGTALLGRSCGNPALILLGLGGALFHVINHAVFKGLLFLGAGSVIHAGGTREIDLMGGLAKYLPRTSLCFLIGAVAICGLPPLNGFSSEFLVYLGLFRGAVSSVSGTSFIVLAIPALALVGGLALACFAKVYGVVFLGLPRREQSREPREAGPAMLLPMGFLALLCVLIGIFPQGAVTLLAPAAAVWLPAGGQIPTLTGLAPMGWITVMGTLLILLALLIAWVALKRRQYGVSTTGTWDCGYLQPTPRMQYTASSFAESIVGLFGGILRPRRHQPEIAGPFPAPSHFARHVPEAALELVFLPLLKRIDRLLVPLRKIQHGQIPVYILYIFVTVIVLLALTP